MINDKKVSKAQLEVWEWKDKLYNEVKNMNSKEALKYLVKKSEKTVESLKLSQESKQKKSA